MKKIDLINRNAAWLRSEIPLGQKLGYYPSMMIALAGGMFGRKSIRYLGNKVAYDNPAAPLSLQAYPHEITAKVLHHLPRLPKKVLDIGGNIGQFSITLSTVLNRKVDIDVFEPNPAAFELLAKNTAPHQNIRIYNLGLGKRGKTKMFYEPGRSAIGSMFKQNAGSDGRVKPVDIEVVDDISAQTGSSKYDLIKIDVEGYEYDLLKSIKPVQTDYLFIEVSCRGRHKDFDHSSLFELIAKRFGKFDILFSTPVTTGIDNFEVLVSFI